MATTSASTTGALDAGTRLAVDRTRLAYERTLMAWVRTSISLITFGFTIYKFFQFERPGAEQRVGITSNIFGMLMILIGLFSLLAATMEHRRDLNALKAEFPHIPRSLARVFAGLVSLLGILALAAVILRQ